MKLLIGYDGSECADAALEDLRRAGLPDTAGAIVISVADMLPMPDRSAAAPPAAEWLAAAVERAHARRTRAVDDMRAHAETAAERLRRDFPKWAVSAEAVGDSPAWGILKRAWEWRP